MCIESEVERGKHTFHQPCCRVELLQAFKRGYVGRELEGNIIAVNIDPLDSQL